MRSLWRPAFLAHVAAVHADGTNSCVFAAARCRAHCRPLHVVGCALSRCIDAFRCIGRVCCTLCVDSCCCSVGAARFPLPSCTVPAARRRPHVVCSRASHVFGRSRMRRWANPRNGRSAPPRAVRCPVWLHAASQVAALPVVCCPPPACAECTHARTRVPHAGSLWRRRRRPGRRRKRSFPRGAPPRARMALPSAAPPRTDPLAAGVLSGQRCRLRVVCCTLSASW